MTAFHFFIIKTDIAIVLDKDIWAHSTTSVAVTLPSMPASAFASDNKVPIRFNPSIYRTSARGVVGRIAVPVCFTMVVQHQVAIALEDKSPITIVRGAPVTILQSLSRVKAIIVVIIIAVKVAFTVIFIIVRVDLWYLHPDQLPILNANASYQINAMTWVKLVIRT